MDQQNQTRQYFDTHADEWQSKSIRAGGKYNIVEARNGAVLTVIDQIGDVRRFLDVGCGTGQLVLQVARRGIGSKGIDFASDMIKLCETNRRNAGVKAEFSCLSFFDMPIDGPSYDVISAQGFIEYISPEQVDLFLTRCFSMLRAGGALVVGSRNRLFNLLSLNEYTLAEIRLGTVERLLAEAIALHQNTSVQSAFEALRRHERIDPQPESHPHTGIGVEVRYQYSPAELIKRARMNGFVPRTLFPIHFHGIPGAVKSKYPGMHVELSTMMGRLAPLDCRLVPYCSSFVVDVRKTG